MMQSSKNKPACFSATLKRLFIFSMPMIASQLLGVLPSLASIWILSRLGKDQLAAAAIAVPTFYTVLTVFSAGFIAVGIKVGYCFGKHRESPEISGWLHCGFFLAVLFTLPGMIVLLNIHHLLLWCGQKPHLVSIAQPFFDFGAYGLIAILLSSVINQYFIGIGHPRIAFILSVVTLPLVVALSYAFVLGKFHFPRLGLAGINCAAMIVDFVVLFCAIAIAIFAKWSKPYRLISSSWGVTRARCFELIDLGWPISIQVGGEILCMTMAAYMLGLFGVSALAAAQITGQYTLLFIMASIGLSSAVSIMVSQANGEHDAQAVKYTVVSGLLLISLLALTFTFGFLVIPRYLTDLYLDISHSAHNLVVDYAIDFMRIAAVYLMFDGLRNVLSNSLRGLQDPKVPMKIGLGCLSLVGLPCAAIAGFVFPGGAVWLRIGFVLGVVVGTVWLAFRCLDKMKSLVLCVPAKAKHGPIL